MSTSAPERAPSTASPSSTFAYQPALDGVRAVSVLLVLLFHAGLPWMRAGYLGVSVFFTLSGFLITSLLLVEHRRTGTVRVGAFYARRVKRLLPASTVCLAGVVIARHLGAFRDVDGLRSDVIGAVLQVFNWVQLAGSGSYGDLFRSATSPLEHYWSLSIEEQFYWVWPVLVLLVGRAARRRGAGRLRRPLVATLAVLTVLAMVAAPLVAQVWGPDAAYWATPARLAEILIGALLAALLHGRRVSARVGVLAAPSLVAIVALSALLPSSSGPAYEGLLPVFALITAMLILSLQTEGPVRRLLSLRPLVGVGAISYGLYLYHWPVFVLLRERGWQLDRPADLAGALGITFAIAITSYRLIERPVRHRVVRPASSLRLAGLVTAGVLASSVLVAPGVPAIQADEELLGAAAIQPPADGTLAPLVAQRPAVPSDGATTTSTTDAPNGVPLVSIDASPVTEPGASSGDTSPVETVAPTTTTMPLSIPLPPAPSRPVRILVVGDSTALYVAQGLAAWSTAAPGFAQVSVSWCQGCTFQLDAEITSFDLDDVVDNSRRTLDEVMPQAIHDLQPDVVVFMATVSEAANRQWSPDEGPLGPTDPRFHDRMVDRYAQLTMSVLQQGVPHVVWVVPPTPNHLWSADDAEMNEPERYAAHHQIVRDAAARFDSHVDLVDLDAWVQAMGLATDPAFRADGVHIDVAPATDLAARYLGPWLVLEALQP
ncbi:MAG: acyltransferase family protein [Acidimicrobiales bacterium]